MIAIAAVWSWLSSGQACCCGCGEGGGRGEQRDGDSCCGPDFPLDKPAALGVPVSHTADEGHGDQCEQGIEAAGEGGDRGEQGGGRS